jgi:parallel beta helix pectate lyase-like protein
MAWNPAHRDRFFAERPSRKNIFWMSLGIVVFLLLLFYVVEHFPGATVVNHESSASNCTLFASATGKDANSGASPSSPKSFSGAATATQPGSVVCLLGGTYSLISSFKPPSSGTPSSWIVYKDYGDGPVNFVWTGAADASAMFHIGGGSFPSQPSYLEFRGLNLDGQSNAADGFFCRGSHHVRFINNSISNTGGSGIASINCDYLTANHNLIYHNGYLPSTTAVPGDYGWTSGISFNSSQWFDNHHGFHNIISGNIIAGEYDGSDHHTDGNGIILDLSSGSYDPSTANTPPALIINNVVYGNGGRCIVAYVVSNFWIVNNTCYKNNLDSTLKNAGSIETNDSHDGYFINNIALAWSSTHPAYEQQDSNSNILYYSNMYFGAASNFTYPEHSQLLQADPLFLDPPVLDPKLPGQYATVLPPSELGRRLALLPSSPAIARGIDPATLGNLPPAISTDLKKYVYSDIKGNRRPPGGPFDLGAYQSGDHH